MGQTMTPPASDRNLKKISETLTSGCRVKITQLNYLIYAALPAAFTAISFYGLHRGGWKMFFAMFPFAIFFAVFAALLASERARLKRSSLTIDPSRGVIIFHHFRFVATFLPEKPRETEKVLFDQILDVRFRHGEKGGPNRLEIKTTKGALVVSDEMEDFELIGSILGEIVTANKSNVAEYQKALQARPKIKTAWYGWLILLGAIAIVAFIVWKFMFEN